MEYKKKLIEVALPLEKINAESAREKSIRHGHPSTLHLWWARRPLAAARAVIWSSLVDDPSAHPELFPAEEDQDKERERLFKILENLVSWDNIVSDDVLNEAKREINKSVNDTPPTFLDPFAGGGTIPIEAQRLGLKAYAHDLNPVAVMINKAMIEFPSIFGGRSPVNPDARLLLDANSSGLSGANGMADDVCYYGEWIKKEAIKRIGHLYPKVNIPLKQGGGTATVIAWIWSRTVKCPNPACGCQMPLASTFVLSKKKGCEAYVEPQFDFEEKKITYKVRQDKGKAPDAPKLSRGAKFKCIMCGESTSDEYIKSYANSVGVGATLIGVIAEGEKNRLFISPDDIQKNAAEVLKPEDYPSEGLPYDPRNIWCVNYGLDTYDKLFTNRQLWAMTTFSSLVEEVERIIEEDAISAGLKDDHMPLQAGGTGAKAYSQAIGAYLAFAVDRCADYYSSLATWSGEFVAHTFGRQALPMTWDFAECNPFSDSTGNWSSAVNWIVMAMKRFPKEGKLSCAKQFDAQSDAGFHGIMVSTDPPYYDNINYANLADYFYVWMRRSLKHSFSELFGTMLTPKVEELVACPYRFDGDSGKAKQFFEDGMLEACKRIYEYTDDSIPLTLYYAYKQSESSESGESSSGWETMLAAVINAGFSITGTWPMRTERTVGLKGSTNMLASSIILVCRKRPVDAPQTTKKNLVNTLRRELRPALKKLQDSNIAPVDLAQSAIGPGMGVFSRYKRVLEADGSEMSVRSALQVINEEIDLFFNEQVGSMDTASRFCVDLYTQCAYNDIKYGEAEVLANAKGTSIPMMASHGVLYAKAGIVHLVERENLPEKIETNESNIWMLTQQLTQAMAKGGVEACAQAVYNMFGSNAEHAKDLAYRLYTIAERKGWANEAYAYNSLVVAWPDIQTRAAELKAVQPEQLTMF